MHLSSPLLRPRREADSGAAGVTCAFRLCPQTGTANGRRVRDLLQRFSPPPTPCKNDGQSPENHGNSASCCSAKEGVFAQRGQVLRGLSREHTCKTPPYRSVHDPFKTASGVHNSGPWDPWLPAVENSRLFTQRMVCPQNGVVGAHREKAQAAKPLRIEARMAISAEVPVTAVTELNLFA